MQAGDTERLVEDLVRALRFEYEQCPCYVSDAGSEHMEGHRRTAQLLRRLNSESLEVTKEQSAETVVHVVVRWYDGYLEHFDASEVRFGSDLLWMRLLNGENRNIPLRGVRWFSTTPESHATSRVV